MQELSFSTLSAAALFALATSITPGPNNTMLLASGVNFGWRRTWPHLLGVSAGLLLMLVLAAFGVQQWLFEQRGIQQALQWFGSLYMVYLAVGLCKTDASLTRSHPSAARPMGFVAAAAFQWVNPKVWVMVLGFFSTYVPPSSTLTQALLLCSVFALVNLPCVGSWAMAGDRMSRWLQSGHRLRWFNRGMAVLLVLSVLAAWSGPAVP